ncbi:hypothetical protein QQ045_011132 [Rhodiola kirilowii]
MMRLSFNPLLLTVLATLLKYFSPNTIVGAEETYVAHLCSVQNYTSNSTYETNLHSLMSTLTSQNGVSNGFYHASEGQNDQDAVTGYALCRGDVSQSACNSCVNISATYILHKCPTHVGAIVWYDNCMLRYSPSSDSGNLPPGHLYYWADQLHDPVINASDLGAYFVARVNLLSTLARRASTGNSTRKFATGDVNFTTSGKIYALLQCIPDLGEEQCAQCLNLAAKKMPFTGQRLRALTSACDLRVAPMQFDNGSDSAPGPYSLPRPYSLPPDVTYMKGNTQRYVLVIIVLTVCCMLLIASVCIFLCLMRRKEKITNVNVPRSAVPSSYGLQNIRVDTDAERPERRGGGAAAAASKGRPIMEIPMLAAQSAETSVNTGDGTSSYTWILKTPVNHPSPR